MLSSPKELQTLVVETYIWLHNEKLSPLTSEKTLPRISYSRFAAESLGLDLVSQKKSKARCCTTLRLTRQQRCPLARSPEGLLLKSTAHKLHLAMEADPRRWLKTYRRKNVLNCSQKSRVCHTVSSVSSLQIPSPPCLFPFYLCFTVALGKLAIELVFFFSCSLDRAERTWWLDQLFLIY